MDPDFQKLLATSTAQSAIRAALMWFAGFAGWPYLKDNLGTAGAFITSGLALLLTVAWSRAAAKKNLLTPPPGSTSTGGAPLPPQGSPGAGGGPPTAATSASATCMPFGLKFGFGWPVTGA